MQCRIVDIRELSTLRDKHPGKRIVFTNGCFDILHVGHIRCLRDIRKLGDVLVLGLNSDYSVKRQKGDTRPVNPQDERAEMLMQYDFIDYIVIFDEDTPENIISVLKPDIWAKGGDYNADNLPGKQLADSLGIRLVFVPFVEGKIYHGNPAKMNHVEESKTVRIAVIGDTALDMTYCSHPSDEPSAETGLPVNYVDEVLMDAGGAGNLASDISLLGGAQVDLYGFCGMDYYADMLRVSLRRNGVNCNGLLACKQTSTYVYHRIFDAHMTELPRYDIGPGNLYSANDAKCLLNQIKDHFSSYDMIIINQQLSSGIYTKQFVDGLTELLQMVSIPVWVDSRDALILPNCSYKINLKEAMLVAGETNPRQCIETIYDKYVAAKNNCQYVVITLGGEGAIAFDGEHYYETNGIPADWVMDTVGAGDAFLAALCRCLVGKMPFEQALMYANAAGTVSTKYLRRCGHPTRSEIEEVLLQYRK